jgi:hypothetical protein
MIIRHFTSRFATAGLCWIAVSFCAVLGLAQTAGNAGSQNAPGCGPMTRSPNPTDRDLDRAACQMKADDETSVKAVADAVFNVPRHCCPVKSRRESVG